MSKKEVKKEETKVAPAKPISVAREEFYLGIANLCNNSGLPFFVMEDILNKVVNEVHLLANKQLESDKERYNKGLLEFQNSSSEKKEAE